MKDPEMSDRGPSGPSFVPICFLAVRTKPEGMSPLRMIFMALGIAIFIFGVYLFFFEAGLEQWVSIGILTAGVIIFVGLLVMGFASGAPRDEPAGREVHDKEVVRDREPAGGERHVHHHRE